MNGVGSAVVDASHAKSRTSGAVTLVRRGLVREGLWRLHRCGDGGYIGARDGGYIRAEMVVTSVRRVPAPSFSAPFPHRRFQVMAFSFTDPADSGRRLEVLDSSSPLCLTKHDEHLLAKHAVLMTRPEFASTSDKRNAALKTEAGHKSSNKGYATARGTHWLHTVHAGTPRERALTKFDFLDAYVLYDGLQDGGFGRPPIPSHRSGSKFVHAFPALERWLVRHAGRVAAAKHELNSAWAESDVHDTSTTCYARGGVVEEYISGGLFNCRSPGLSGLTFNAQLTTIADLSDHTPPTPPTKGAIELYVPARQQPESFRLSTAFPISGRQTASNEHTDSLDKHGSLAYLGVFTYDPYKVLQGGEFFARISGSVNLAVSPDKALPVLGTFYNISHAAALTVGKECLDTDRKETLPLRHDCVLAFLMAASVAVPRLGAGCVAPLRSMTVELLKHIVSFADEVLDELALPDGERVIAVRGSLVMQTSALVCHSLRLMRERCRAGTLAVSTNQRQKQWLLRAGLIPLNANEFGRPRHQDLRNAVKDYPINNPVACTPDSLLPYCQWAALHWQEFEQAYYDEEEVAEEE